MDFAWKVSFVVGEGSVGLFILQSNKCERDNKAFIDSPVRVSCFTHDIETITPVPDMTVRSKEY